MMVLQEVTETIVGPPHLEPMDTEMERPRVEALVTEHQLLEEALELTNLLHVLHQEVIAIADHLEIAVALEVQDIEVLVAVLEVQDIEVLVGLAVAQEALEALAVLVGLLVVDRLEEEVVAEEEIKFKNQVA